MRYSIKHKLYTVAEVARLLQLSTLTVYKYIREKKIEAIDLSGHYRISSMALQRFIENHTIHLDTKEST